MKKLNSLFLASIIISISIFSSVWAGNRPGIHPLLSDDFSVSLGWYYAKSETNIIARGDKDIGDDLDLEDDLNFDNNTGVFLGEIKWRFTKSFLVSYEYLAINRDASAELNKNISWDDINFAAGAEVNSEFNIDVHRLFVGYSFIQSKQLELGAGLGLHLTDLEVGLSGQATVDGQHIGSVSSRKDGLAPLPNIGFYGAYAFSPKIIARVRGDWFSANIGDYDGTLVSAVADIQYQAFKHVGFGAGYHFLDIDIEVEKSDWKGKVDFSYNGPKLFMTINF